MENNYLPSSSIGAEGSTDHLHFSRHWLHIGGDCKPGGSPSGTVSFFSLDAAIADVALGKLSDLNFKMAQGHEHVGEGVITNLVTGMPLVSVWANGNGLRDRIDLPEGIYLHFTDGLAVARMVTGLPIFADDKLQSRYEMPLAYFKGQNLEYTNGYINLIKASAERLEKVYGVDQRYPLRLTFKGFEFRPAAVGRNRRVSRRLLEHHYFAGLHPAARGLLSQNLYLYDGFGKNNAAPAHYTHAYISGPEPEDFCYIKTIPFGQSQPGEKAGIYLVATDPISTFEKQAALSLGHLPGYLPDAHQILIAGYGSRNDYHLQAPHTSPEVAGISIEQPGVKVVPSEAFHLNIRYQENGGSKRVEPLFASDSIYVGTPSSGIDQLLAINPQQFLAPPAIASYGFTIKAAALYDPKGEELASLKVEMRGYDLQLVMDIKNSQHLPTLLRHAIGAITGVHLYDATVTTVSLPVASVDKHNVMQQMPSAFFLRQLIESFDVWSVTRAHDTHALQSSRPYVVEQKWQKHKDGKPSTRKEQWTVADLDKARSVFDLVDSRQFFGPIDDGYQLSAISLHRFGGGPAFARRSLTTENGQPAMLREFDMGFDEGRHLAVGFRAYHKIIATPAGSMTIAFVESQGLGNKPAKRVRVDAPSGHGLSK